MFYKKFCNTDKQYKVLQAYIETGSASEAARLLGFSPRTCRRIVQNIKERAAKAGYAPESQIDSPAPAGYTVPHITAQYDQDGIIKQSWIRYKPEQIKFENAIIQAIENGDFSPYKAVPGPISSDKNLHTDYYFTDYHLGMYAWSKECGDDWDMKIAEATYMDALCDLMDRSPDSHSCSFVQMGDFMHWDGVLAVTPTSQYIVDADTRYEKLVELAMRITIKTVELLLRKHSVVYDIQMEGNHDISGSIWLRKHHKMMLEKNPRVIVDDTAFPYYGRLFGTNFLGYHHGHKRKNKQIAEFFASSPRYRTMWGQAKRSYIKTGHYHNSEAVISEVGGAIVERLPTLAAKDSYAARGGWNSYRSTCAVTYHTTKGQYSSVTTVPVEVVHVD